MRFERLINLVEDRDGHWLAIKAEEAKILLSDHDMVNLQLERLRCKQVSTVCSLTIEQMGLQSAIGHLSVSIANAVSAVIQDAGIRPDQVDTVFFTGGSSGVRGLREQIAAIVPHARKVEGDLFGSIGAGLGLAAARRFA